jgi:PadR family transcriptional regulator, regulatory protein PadR
MPPNLVMSRHTQAVLGSLTADPGRQHHCAEIGIATGLGIGVVYPVLARLEALQWLDSGWEAPSSPEQGWPRRRFYQLSIDGVALARGALASAKAAPVGAVRRLQQAGETG